MRRWTMIAAIIAPMLFAENVLAAQRAEPGPTWLCIADKSTGFKFERGEWRIATFSTAQSKYILRQFPSSADPNKLIYDWVDFGEKRDFALLGCKDNDVSIICEPLGGDVRFNKKTLRFISYYFIGYIHADDSEASDTPLIEIGKCSPIG